MTVNYETGEIVEPQMSADDARKLTERIRYTALSVRDGMEKLQRLVQEAQNGQAHVALGYASWTAYLADTLGKEPLRLPRDKADEMFTFLSGEGMSVRAISAITDTPKSTVADAINRGVRNRTPAGRMAKEEAERFRDAEVRNFNETPEGGATDADVAADRGDTAASAPRSPVTGIDGKTYKRPEPKAAPRRALTDQFFNAAYDLTKAVERVRRLADDDRWSQNAEKVAAKHRNDLLQAIDGLQSVVNRLPSA